MLGPRKKATAYRVALCILAASFLQGCAPESNQKEQVALNEHEAGQYWSSFLEEIGKEEPSHEKARKLLTAAGNGGHPEAVSELGYAYLWGNYEYPTDVKLAREWLTKALHREDPSIYFALADSYRSKGEQRVDEHMVTKWLKLSAESGDPQAMWEMGFRYLEGLGTKANKEAGETLIRKAVESGFSSVDHLVCTLLEGDEYLKIAFDSHLSDLDHTPEEILGSFLDYARILQDFMRERLKGKPAKSGIYSFDGPDELLATVSYYTFRSAALIGSKEAQLMLARMHQHQEFQSKYGERANYWQKRADNNQMLNTGSTAP